MRKFSAIASTLVLSFLLWSCDRADTPVTPTPACITTLITSGGHTQGGCTVLDKVEEYTVNNQTFFKFSYARTAQNCSDIFTAEWYDNACNKVCSEGGFAGFSCADYTNGQPVRVLFQRDVE